MTTPTTPKPDDGGPAFPMPSGLEPKVNIATHYNEGMSLRAYLAMGPWTERELSMMEYRLRTNEPTLDETYAGSYVVPAGSAAERFAEARLMLADALLERLKR